MIVMHCRNRVVDFDKWHAVFASHAQAHRDAGLVLLNLWRGLDDPEEVFFVFEVTNMKKAREFISNPAAAAAAKGSGVLEGEYHFLESGVGY
jgi:hypothetical protein